MSVQRPGRSTSDRETRAPSTASCEPVLAREAPRAIRHPGHDRGARGNFVGDVELAPPAAVGRGMEDDGVLERQWLLELRAAQRVERARGVRPQRHLRA